MLRAFDLIRKATLGCGLALAMFGAAHAGPVDILYSFQGGSDGAEPISGVISDSQGNLYGTTLYGGGSGCGGKGCGTVFRLAPDGAETVLYAFQGGSDGSGSLGLVRDSEGNLYGVTEIVNGHNCRSGCGAVFRLAPDGTMTKLHVFKGGSDGAHPEAGLLLDNRGNLYGTTAGGGTYSGGTVFRIAPNGTESVLYAFCAQTNCTDGKMPWSALIADQVGNLYGTTVTGGPTPGGGGTVFKLAPDGTETVLYSFCQQPDCTDGLEPYAGVTMDKVGNLYGTTSWGGALDDSGLGTVFKLAPDGTETVLHSFWPQTDGANPVSGVVVDKAGDIYGTVPITDVCKYEHDPVYRLSPDGSEKLYCVPSINDPGVMDRNGTLYGTGPGGGKYNEGFVFAIKKH